MALEDQRAAYEAEQESILMKSECFQADFQAENQVESKVIRIAVA